MGTTYKSVVKSCRSERIERHPAAEQVAFTRDGYGAVWKLAVPATELRIVRVGDVEVEIDIAALAKEVAANAIHNTSGYAQLVGGLVKAKVVGETLVEERNLIEARNLKYMRSEASGYREITDK